MKRGSRVEKETEALKRREKECGLLYQSNRKTV